MTDLLSWLVIVMLFAILYVLEEILKYTKQSARKP